MNIISNKLLIIFFYFILSSVNSLNFSEVNQITYPKENDLLKAGRLPGFVISPYFDEQVCSFNYDSDIKVLINASSIENFNPDNPTKLILFALPNGNTIEQTVGKHLNPGDDWHYDIQHIGAQIRFLRNQSPNNNLVIAYLETAQKSWPVWKSKHPDYSSIINSLVNYLTDLFSNYNPTVILTGHSGGGSFTFGFIDDVIEIPNNIERISFLDSNYGYDDKYGSKILDWIKASPEHYLSVIAYDDSVALYNEKPVVSAKGGTWYRSKMMKDFLDDYFDFTSEEDNDFINYTALGGRIKFILKKNPHRLILHTVQVELNGFIQVMVSGSNMEGIGYKYYGQRAYSQFIQDGKILPGILMIPPRPAGSLTGSQFMDKVMNMTFEQRELEIYNQLSLGNIPDFLRTTTKITSHFLDVSGKDDTCTYEVMPDYLAIGSDEDFCRILMGPLTAQKIADLYGAVLPTAKLVDEIYKNSLIKLEPVTYKPVGEENTFIAKFLLHNQAIENQRIAAGGVPGQLIAGIKKDVVISNKIVDSSRQNNVVIYGWHKTDGTPIQPLTNIHKNYYVDYSHGIRLLNEEILIDSVTMNIKSILSDSLLYKLLSNEDGPMIQTSYILEDKRNSGSDINSKK